MYDMEYVFNGDCDVRVFKARTVRATQRPDMAEIEHLLDAKCDEEATKLFRLAWRMQDHGCSKESVQACRDEADMLHSRMRRWEVLNPFVGWKYAFKC